LVVQVNFAHVGINVHLNVDVIESTNLSLGTAYISTDVDAQLLFEVVCVNVLVGVFHLRVDFSVDVLLDVVRAI
jgi:hypothetical protein